MYPAELALCPVYAPVPTLFALLVAVALPYLFGTPKPAKEEETEAYLLILRDDQQIT